MSRGPLIILDGKTKFYLFIRLLWLFTSVPVSHVALVKLSTPGQNVTSDCFVILKDTDFIQIKANEN